MLASGFVRVDAKRGTRTHGTRVCHVAHRHLATPPQITARLKHVVERVAARRGGGRRGGGRRGRSGSGRAHVRHRAEGVGAEEVCVWLKEKMGDGTRTVLASFCAFNLSGLAAAGSIS